MEGGEEEGRGKGMEDVELLRVYAVFAQGTSTVLILWASFRSLFRPEVFDHTLAVRKLGWRPADAVADGGQRSRDR